ncbi:LPS translocon maturation chaperone LptM [Marinomonas balearica]
MYRWLFAFVFITMLSACGNKGALYLPAEKNSEQNQDTSSSQNAQN